jgi:hypothetical protein
VACGAINKKSEVNRLKFENIIKFFYNIYTIKKTVTANKIKRYFGEIEKV